MEYLTVYSSYPYEKIRLGKEFDDGYVICDEINYDLLLSCGISNDISFEEEFTKKYNVKCIAFNETINKLPNTDNNIIWIKKNIDPANTDKTTNLKDFLNNFKNIFLKMDIESYEFNWIKNITNEELKNISQIAIEIHFPFTKTSLNNWIKHFDKSIEEPSEKTKIFKRLAETHYLVHIHGNNFCGVTKYNNIDVPNILKCTYLRKDLFKNNAFKNFKNIPDKDLDYPNNNNYPDINLSYYPFVHKKPIIFTMTHNPKNIKYKNEIGSNMFGFGNIIQGIIALNKYCKKNNYELYLDAQNHLLNDYLLINNNPYKEFIKDNSNNIFFLLDKYYVEGAPDISLFINNHNINTPMILYTNLSYFEKIDNEDKNYIKENFLKPNYLIERNINYLLLNYNYKDNYEILHCRLDDSEFTEKNNSSKYLEIYNKIKKFINKNTILLSNSEFFKKYIKDNYPEIFFLNTKSAHLGYKDSNILDVIDTLSEFFIITRSSKIYTYSEYKWISTFVKTVNDIYDIPLIDIKSVT